MLQDIAPLRFYPEYNPRRPRENDRVLMFCDEEVQLAGSPASPDIPVYRNVKKLLDTGTLRYLFSVDKTAFFMADPGRLTDDFFSADISVFRKFTPEWMGFAGITGSHLYDWYNARRYCGRCGTAMVHLEKERALRCPVCKRIEYPKINPVVMVAVTKGDYLLVTMYAGGTYSMYSMVAGFVEIGESFEEAAKREVMEETGLAIKNLRYHKSQPWAFSGSLLAGFFADLDGEDHIEVDNIELKEAKWIHYSDIPADDKFDKSGFSLSSDLVLSFYKQKQRSL